MQIFERRAWGFIPLLLFSLKVWQYLPPADSYQIFWFCNVSNLLLGVGILCRIPNLIFICSVLLTIGLPIWIFDFIVNGDFHPFSVLTHVVSPVLGFLVARRLGWTRHALWQVPVYYLSLQILARLVTPAALNINVAFAVYAPVKAIFPAFWFYSLVNLAGLTIFAAVMDRLFRRKSI